MAINNLDFDLFRKDVEAQTKCVGVKYKVSFAKWVVASLIRAPSDIGVLNNWLTVLWLTCICISRRVFEYIASVSLGRIAVVLGRAAPSEVGSGIQRESGLGGCG